MEVYIRYLRRKLGAASIETVRGMGLPLPRTGRNLTAFFSPSHPRLISAC